ncbi:hypothetical protein [Alienimonas californiensis]|uniref:Uncharacterized protein n=1 Tax=Alienimonas californiensis TaxID=2527989 RepID=A0A517P935_9PLAN|nr:hypothetical protein [Alienimonas californiensis]QDT15878.1 hypothetical protein CA12_19740 [Alienimonas californiensis]
MTRPLRRLLGWSVAAALGLWVGGCWVSARGGHERFVRTASDLGGRVGSLTPPIGFYSEYGVGFPDRRPPLTDEEVSRLARSTSGLLDGVVRIHAPAEDAMTEEQIATLLRTAPAVSSVYARGGWWSLGADRDIAFYPDPEEDDGPHVAEPPCDDSPQHGPADAPEITPPPST